MNEDHKFYFQLFSIRDVDVLQIWKQLATKKKIKTKDVKKFLDVIMLNQEDLCKREIIRGFFEEMLRQNLFECKVYSFGSTTSGLSLYDSDIDFHVRLYLPNGKIRRLNKQESKAPLMEMRKIFRSKLNHYFSTLFIDASCPIIKLNSNRNRINRKMFTCDLNVTNPFGIYNSIFLSFLCEFCPKFQMVAVLLRLWAKCNDLICFSSMNSYTFTMLVLFFFQNEKILLPFEQLGINFSDYFFETDPDTFKQLIRDKCKALVCETELSIFDLLRRFFVFYAKFDYYQFVISTRLGRPIRKNEFIDIIVDGGYDFTMNNTLCVEDPFELERNISKNIKFIKIIQFVQQCEELRKKDNNYFRDGQNFFKFITKKRFNEYRTPALINPCLCCIKSVLESNNENFFYNFMVYYGENIIQKFREFHLNEKNFSNADIKGQVIEMNEHFESFKEFLLQNLLKQFEKPIYITDLTIETTKRIKKNNASKSRRMAKNLNPILPGPSNRLSSQSNEIPMELDNDQSEILNDNKKKQVQNFDQNIPGPSNRLPIEDDEIHMEFDDDQPNTERFRTSLVLMQCGENFGYFSLLGSPYNTSRLVTFIQKKICSCRPQQRQRKRFEDNNSKQKMKNKKQPLPSSEKNKQTNKQMI
uniref:Poly(A) RNA polymerase, mitochondrial-like isoform X2 n=1 Tax=Dermatophagoides pteronyssinus TaxID=6956 RepID=A0A6P6XY22_DERPT|nr:poly(A) RNA polymerase, mitochondrial-like isoform X2 [Dermatophagoides pteronyssinus]